METQAYLSSELFNNNIVVELKPVLQNYTWCANVFSRTTTHPFVSGLPQPQVYPDANKN